MFWSAERTERTAIPSLALRLSAGSWTGSASSDGAIELRHHVDYAVEARGSTAGVGYQARLCRVNGGTLTTKRNRCFATCIAAELPGTLEVFGSCPPS
jgi:hypothetical protein